MDLPERQAEVRLQLQRGKSEGSQTLKPRKSWTRDKVDYNTLHAMYLDKNMSINEIARRINRTRARVWQILKEYGLHIKYRKQMDSVCAYCNKSFKVWLSVVNNGRGKYCCNEHYYEHKRAVSDYQPHRQGQRTARKRIEDWLGHKLPGHCIIHHEDGNHDHNEFNNIFVFPSHSDHLKYHHAKRHGKVVLPYREISELPDKLKAWFPV